MKTLSQQEPTTLDYATRKPSAPDRLVLFEQAAMAVSATTLVLLLGYRLAVVISPWTWDALCSAADNNLPISSAATEFTDIGVWLHMVAGLLSSLLGLFTMVLVFVAVQAHRKRTALLLAAALAGNAIAFLLSTAWMSLAGF